MNKILSYILGVGLLCLQSCSNYLDAKPDSSLAIPDNVRDLQALLDYEDQSILYYPAAGDIAADYYFLKETDWLSRSIDVRNTYIWAGNDQNRQDWSSNYNKIFYSNVVLDEIDNAKLGNMTEADRREVKGRAHFFRGWTYFHLAQLYSPYYAFGDEDSGYGLPLKLKADINEPIIRSTVKETYEQIIYDLSQAADLLPDQVGLQVRPSKAAAYAALARLYLILADYEKALNYAQFCLNIPHELIDHNELNSDLNLPFKEFNSEVIFHAVTLATSGAHNLSIAYVDSTMPDKYKAGDLRKILFFRQESKAYYRFKGSYEGTIYSLFGGLALDEVYLVKAESEARMGLETEALATINKLLVTRWSSGEFSPLANIKGEELLKLILEEREKQLLFRGGIRWSDLRRLNRDSRFARTLKRKIGDVVYELPPNDLRYTFLLPFDVVEISGIKQNPR